jgi:excisionase family DNA binding protein
MPTAIEERDYLTPAEAARQLHVSVSTVWRWIDKGKLPAYRVGERFIRIPKAGLSQVVRSARQPDVALGPPREEELEGKRLERQRRGEEFLKMTRKLREDMLRRRGGVPLPDSWEDIRAAREERDREIDAWLPAK